MRKIYQIPLLTFFLSFKNVKGQTTHITREFSHHLVWVTRIWRVLILKFSAVWGLKYVSEIHTIKYRQFSAFPRTRHTVHFLYKYVRTHWKKTVLMAPVSLLSFKINILVFFFAKKVLDTDDRSHIIMSESSPECCGKKCKFSPTVLECLINYDESRNTFFFCRLRGVWLDDLLEWLIISTDSQSWETKVPGMKEQTGANVNMIYSCEPNGNMKKSEKHLQPYRSVGFPLWSPKPIYPPDVKHQHCNVTQSDL